MGIKRKAPEELHAQFATQEEHVLNNAWDAMDEVFVEVPSRRMRGKVNRMIALESVRDWGAALSLAGLMATLLVGIAVGRFSVPGPVSGIELTLASQLLHGQSTGLRLEALLTLRRAEQLPPGAIEELKRLLRNPNLSVGVQLAAVEVLAAHPAQPRVRALIEQMLRANGRNPMITTRLQEVSALTKEII